MKQNSLIKVIAHRLCVRGRGPGVVECQQKSETGNLAYQAYEKDHNTTH